MDEQLSWGCVRWLVTKIFWIDDPMTCIWLGQYKFIIVLDDIWGANIALHPSKSLPISLNQLFGGHARGWYVSHQIILFCLLSHVTNLPSLLSIAATQMCRKSTWFVLFRWCHGPSNPFYGCIQKHKTDTLVKIQTNIRIKAKIKKASTITKKQPCFFSSSLASSFLQQGPSGLGKRVSSVK